MAKWKTTDFYLTAYLHTQGYHVEVDPESTPGKAIFVIEDDERRQELVDMYLQKKALVDPLELKQSIQIIKSMMYNR